LDIERLVDLATKEIYKRLTGGVKRVVTFGDVPAELVAGAEIRAGRCCTDADGCDYVVMSAASFYEMMGGKRESKTPVVTGSRDGTVIDLRGKRLIHERDLRSLDAARGDLVKVSKNAIITALAHDYVKGIGAKIEKV
jgi:hypothetical protein